MEGRLFQAACSGDVDALYESVRRDAAILQKLQSGGPADTPLHLASMFGHINFVREYLVLSKISPNQLSQISADGYSPLHLASANGHLAVVQILLEFVKQSSPVENICLKKGRDCRTALHSATITGKIDVMDVLLAACPMAAVEVTVKKETVLHLAVEHHQHDALQFLILKLGAAAGDLLNLGDREGNTVLHLATAKRQLQTVEFLVKQPGLDVNAKNSYGLTVLDVMFACGFYSKDMYIEEAIRLAGGCRSQIVATNVVPPLHQNSSNTAGSNGQERTKEATKKWLKQMRNGIMVLASLIATLTFQVAVTPLGGFWQGWGPSTAPSNGPVSPPQHKPGDAVLFDLPSGGYTDLMVLNTLAFFFSVTTILAMLQRWTMHSKILALAQIAAHISVFCVAAEFFQIVWLTNRKFLQILATAVFFIFWFALLGFNICGHRLSFRFYPARARNAENS